MWELTTADSTDYQCVLSVLRRWRRGRFASACALQRFARRPSPPFPRAPFHLIGPFPRDMIAAGYPEPTVKLPLMGYRFFWVVLGAIVSALTLLMWRFGLFRALQ